MEVARGHGGDSSPRKYGLKGTIPAMVKRTEGSCGMRLAEGTTLWPRSAKKRVKAARSPLASITAAYRGEKRLRGRSGVRNGPGRGPGWGPGSGQAQAEDIPTMGLFRWMLPVDPKNGMLP